MQWKIKEKKRGGKWKIRTNSSPKPKHVNNHFTCKWPKYY